MTAPALLDQFGRPLAHNGWQAGGYTGASRTHQDLAAWVPRRHSAASSLPALDRDLLNARIHDQARNDGWASAGIDRLVDNIVGGGWRLNVKLNSRALKLSDAQATDLAGEIESAFEDYANDSDCWCDAGMRNTFGGLLALAYRHRGMDGESLAVIQYLDRGGPWATALQIVDPDRLEQPDWSPETPNFRQGIELGPNGEPVAYHIRVMHPADAFGVNTSFALGPLQFERVPRFKSGRRVVLHAFEAHRAGQVRGISQLAAIVKKLRMLGRYDEAELQAAVLNAVMAAFVTSPFDHAELAEAMAGGAQNPLNDYVSGRLGYWNDAPPIRMPGVAVNFMYPGEDVKFPKPSHPHAASDVFVRGALRNVASAIGLSYEQLSADWGEVNYSSARAALIEIWRGFTARAAHFCAGFVQPWYVRWFEEAVARGRIVLPAGSPSFRQAKTAWTGALWRMPGRGWVDPLKEAEAAGERIRLGISSLEREAAEQGLDWEETLAQKARELARARELEREHGLPEGSLMSVDPAPGVRESARSATDSVTVKK